MSLADRTVRQSLRSRCNQGAAPEAPAVQHAQHLSEEAARLFTSGMDRWLLARALRPMRGLANAARGADQRN